jgi:methionine-rich copper-binding protein CopC
MLVVAACAAGCAGNGEGLDQNGQPITPGGSGGGPVTADFQSIQENVFTPICSKCHIGASAPEGLQLDASHSYNLLVGVPSAERPDLLRVDPGHPDTSYMVLKIEGASGIVGARMPFGETPLPQATIDAIRQWITNGAPSAAAASPAATAMFAVQTTAPLDSAVVKAPVRRIVVAFSQELDASLVNETTVSVARLVDSEREGTAASVATAVPVSVGLAPQNPAVMLITPQTALERGVYRATLRGTGGGALANLSATTLGADVSFEFTVDTP